MNDDLISRAALLDSYDVCKVTEYDESGCGVTYMAVSVDAIKNAPAVDAEPVRHGRWKLETKRLASCSGCGMLRDIETQTAWEFCPNCGAKMRGDDSASD